MANLVARLFLWLRRHPLAAWMFLLAYGVAVTFAHESVQVAVGGVVQMIGRANWYRLAAGVGLAVAALMTAAFVSALRRQPMRRLMAVYWVATLILVGCAWGFLTANNTELAHYPQYFIPGAVLMAITLSPLESLAWVTLIGGLDECYQYWGMHGGWGIPYDFNDVFMNLLGGALGILFVLAFLRCERAEPAGLGAFLGRALARPGTALVAALVTSGVVLLATGKMLFYEDKQNTTYWLALSRLPSEPVWCCDASWGPKSFHTLSPWEGPALLLAALMFYAVLDWNLSIQAVDERV
ncbi:MAG: VanZ family protein [Bryobacterales bacterium]|nr:VanZ family protein [Bryobacterales bacterium]